jgi:hypothetical protein
MSLQSPIERILSLSFSAAVGQAARTYDPIEGFDTSKMEWIQAQLSLVKTGAGGTPSSTVVLQASINGTDWYDLISFSELTDTGHQSLSAHRFHGTAGLQLLGKFLRLKDTSTTASGVATFAGTLHLLGGL